jgi:hypothetical protein
MSIWDQDIERQRQIILSIMSQAPLPGEELEVFSAVQSMVSLAKMYEVGATGVAIGSLLKLPTGIGAAAPAALSRVPIVAVTSRRIIFVNTSLLDGFSPVNFLTFDFGQVEILVDRPRIWMPLIRFAKLKMSGVTYRFQYYKWQKRFQFNKVVDRIRAHQQSASPVQTTTNTAV